MSHILKSKLKQLTFKHQNNKIWYYFRNNVRRLFPSFIFRNRLGKKLRSLEEFDLDYIQKRVDYYNRLEAGTTLPANTPELSKLKLGKELKVYYFDSYEYTRFFNPQLNAEFLFGDIIHRSEERRVGKECRSRWSP